jgi:hypothetical protein
MIRKTSGYWMINNSPVSIAEGTICDHPDDATVVEYSSEEALMAAHKEANPDLYEDIPVIEEEYA